MKKMISAFLTIVMVFLLSAPCFATDIPATDKDEADNIDTRVCTGNQYIEHTDKDMVIQPTGDGRYKFVEVASYSLNSEDLIFLDEQVSDYVYRADNRYFMNSSSDTLLSCEMLEFPLQDMQDSSFLSGYGFGEAEIEQIDSMCDRARQENWTESKATIYTTISPVSDPSPHYVVPDVDWDGIYRQTFVEYTDLGCPFSDIASGFDLTNDFLTNAFLLGVSFVDSYTGTLLSITSTIGSLL